MNTTKYIHNKLPDLLSGIEHTRYFGPTKAIRFPDQAIKHIGLTSKRLNKLFRAEAIPTLDELVRIGHYYQFSMDQMVEIKIPAKRIRATPTAR